MANEVSGPYESVASESDHNRLTIDSQLLCVYRGSITVEEGKSRESVEDTCGQITKPVALKRCKEKSDCKLAGGYCRKSNFLPLLGLPQAERKIV